MRADIERLARHDCNVLITGPTGTGKGLIARVLHDRSPRCRGPFVAVDGTGLVDGLVASQLFGHRKGAFTGATHDVLGSFRAAQGGTLFLDEIGDLSGTVQATLLHVLEDRDVLPLGSDTVVPVDVRVIAATHRDLTHAIGNGTFRQDLFYRLVVARLETLPLRGRSEDIEPLAQRIEREVFPYDFHVKIACTGCPATAPKTTCRISGSSGWPKSRSARNAVPAARPA